jgi:hypothetical protein
MSILIGSGPRRELMENRDRGLSPEHRTRLAEKGRLLYAKSCQAAGTKTCAESFANDQIQRGQTQVVIDLIAYLEGEAERLRRHDPEGRLTSTLELAARIRDLMPPGAGDMQAPLSIQER